MTRYKEWFDGLILNNLKEKGFGPFGYELNDDPYANYYSRDAFAAFVYEMEHCFSGHYDRYKNGHGSELKETSTPPKMASVASSSRFAYLALRNGAQAIGGTEKVEFEHECRITGIRGTAPQMDAYTTDEDGNPIFVEVKCHEIFDRHCIELSASYWDIFYREGNDFGFPARMEKPSDKTFSIPLAEFGISGESSMVDVKQLLCHLMGASSQKKKEEKESATLVYLFYKPLVEDENSDQLEYVFAKLLVEIDSVFNSKPIRRFCAANKILMKAVVEEAATMERLTKKNIGYQRQYPF